MKPAFVRLAIIGLAFSAAGLAAPAADPAAERIQATFLLTLGRAPTPAEFAAGRPSDASKTAQELLAARVQQLQVDSTLRRAAAIRAFEDAFGRKPSGTELTGAGSTEVSYASRLKEHIRWLATQPDEYRRVIDRAYQLVIRRPVYDSEIEYWKQRETLPYVLLVGCVEGWARRNAPGLMATTGNPSMGVNSAWLTTLSVSPAVAAELRAVTGLIPSGDPDFAIAAGRNVIAPGADQMNSLGGMFIVVVGNHELVKG